jgi:hypothetical protein
MPVKKNSVRRQATETYKKESHIQWEIDFVCKIYDEGLIKIQDSSNMTKQVVICEEWDKLDDDSVEGFPPLDHPFPMITPYNWSSKFQIEILLSWQENMS